MEKEVHLIKCPNCGADHDIHLPKCPYCGFINPEGAEEKYMRDLEDTRKALDDVDDEAVRNVKAEVRDSTGKIVKRITLIVLILLFIAGILFGVEKLTSCDRGGYELTEKEIAWQREVFPQWDALYEAGDYDALADRVFAEDGHRVWDWKHYEFLSWYSRISFIRAAETEMDLTGTCTKEMAESLVYDAFGFYYRDYAPEGQTSVLDEAETAKLDGYREEIITLIRERMRFSDAQMAEWKDKVYDDYGILNFQECKKIAQEHYREFR